VLVESREVVTGQWRDRHISGASSDVSSLGGQEPDVWCAEPPVERVERDPCAHVAVNEIL